MTSSPFGLPANARLQRERSAIRCKPLLGSIGITSLPQSCEVLLKVRHKNLIPNVGFDSTDADIQRTVRSLAVFPYSQHRLRRREIAPVPLRT